jgi:hypothetical protein
MLLLLMMIHPVLHTKMIVADLSVANAFSGLQTHPTLSKHNCVILRNPIPMERLTIWSEEEDTVDDVIFLGRAESTPGTRYSNYM